MLSQSQLDVAIIYKNQIRTLIKRKSIICNDLKINRILQKDLSC